MQTQSYSYSRVIAPFIIAAVAVAVLAVFALPAVAQDVQPLRCERAVNTAGSIDAGTVLVNSTVQFIRYGGSGEDESWSAPGGSPSSYGSSPVFNTKYTTTGTFTVTLTTEVPGESATCTVEVVTKRNQASQQAIEQVKDSLEKAIKKQDAAITAFKAKVVASKLPQESKDALTTLLDEYHVQLAQFKHDAEAATTMEGIRAVLDAVRAARLAFAPELRAAIDGIKESIRAAKEDCSPRKAAPFLAEMVKEAKTVIGKIGITRNAKVLGCNLYNEKTKKSDTLPVDLSQYGTVVFFGDSHSGASMNYQIALPGANPGFLIYVAKTAKGGTMNISLSGNATLGIVGRGDMSLRVTGAPNGTSFDVQSPSSASNAEQLSSCTEVDGDKCSGVTAGRPGTPTLTIEPITTKLDGIGATVTYTLRYDPDGPTVTNEDNVQVGTAPEESVSNSSVIWRLDQFQTNLIKIDRTTGTVTCNKKFQNPQGTTVQVKATYKGAQATAQIMSCGQ